MRKEEKTIERSGVLVMHGWGKSKSHRPLVELSRELTKARAVSFAYRFDFTGHGESEAKFEEASITRFLPDAEGAFDDLVTSQRIHGEDVVLIGHSIGALIAVLLHLRLRRTGPLILISPAIQQGELVRRWYSREEIELCQKQGYLDTPKGRVGWKYFDEALSSDWLSKVASVRVPTLVIHGTEDDDVPMRYAKEVHEKLGGPKDFKLIEGADHKMESHHSKQKIIEYSLAWLKEHL